MRFVAFKPFYCISRIKLEEVSFFQKYYSIILKFSIVCSCKENLQPLYAMLHTENLQVCFMKVGL